MRARRLAVVPALFVALVGTSCGGGPVSGGPTPSTVASASASSSGQSSASEPSAASSASATAPAPPVGTRPVIQCLNGTYRLTRFTDVSADATFRSGSGGDVELDFRGQEFPDGNYVGTAYALAAAGKRTVTLTGADGATSTLTASAKAQGSYSLNDSEARFVPGPGKGSGRLTAAGRTRTLDLAGVQDIVTPKGILIVSCTRSTLWLTGETTQYELHAV